jgi:hypothetical protein
MRVTNFAKIPQNTAIFYLRSSLFAIPQDITQAFLQFKNIRKGSENNPSYDSIFFGGGVYLVFSIHLSV